MIWIGTSGWVYPHWTGVFYPPDLSQNALLSHYAQCFPTVEINRSFYRLPDREQFAAWAAQAAGHPGFVFAVKASRYLTHLKKLREPEEGLARLITAATGLGACLGPFLYQLPPHWHADTLRLAAFCGLLPRQYRAAFELRDPSWYAPAVLRILAESGCALVVAVGGSLPTPPETPDVGPFGYLRFHHGARGIGFGGDELRAWAGHILRVAASGRDVYAYFNNDAEGYAVRDALHLRALLAAEGAPLAA
jgi:uncharacterized protein YecE (DUF72 family)